MGMNQIKRTSYAKSSQIRQIRKKMVEIMQREASSCELKEFVNKIIPEVIGKEITKATQGIYPLQNVYLRKVKVLKAPKFDLMKLMEVHGDYSEVEAGRPRRQRHGGGRGRGGLRLGPPILAAPPRTGRRRDISIRGMRGGHDRRRR